MSIDDMLKAEGKHPCGTLDNHEDRCLDLLQTRKREMKWQGRSQGAQNGCRDKHIKRSTSPSTAKTGFR